MKIFQLIFSILIILVGAFFCIKFYQDGELSINWSKLSSWNEQPSYEAQEPSIKIPEDGVKSNELAIKSLHHLIDSKEPNIVFSPLATEMLLSQIAPLSDETLSTHLNELLKQKNESQLSAGNMPSGLVTFFADSSMPLIANPTTQQLFRAPFSRDRMQALVDVNNFIRIDTQGAILQALSTNEILAGTKLLAVSALNFHYDWVHPMQEMVEDKLSFYDTNSPFSYKVNSIRTIATLRYIRDADYDAVALFYQSNLRESDTPTCLILVMPKILNIRDFSRELTADKLSSIRQSLAEAVPTEIELRMPSFSLQVFPISQKPLFKSLGCDALFTLNKSMPFLTAEDCVLENIWQVYSFSVVAKPLGEKSVTMVDNREEHSNQLIIDRPFLWMVGDLTTDTPPQLMGLIEKF